MRRGRGRLGTDLNEIRVICTLQQGCADIPWQGEIDRPLSIRIGADQYSKLDIINETEFLKRNHRLSGLPQEASLFDGILHLHPKPKNKKWLLVETPADMMVG